MLINNKKIIFLGSSDLSAQILDQILKAGLLITAVVTQPDKAQGRNKKIIFSPVKEIALKYKLPIYQPEKIKELSPILTEINPDLMILVAYGQIIPQSIIDLSKNGILNVHPSLLPKYRGPSPLISALLNGDKITGVSLMLLNKKMDQGPILKQTEIILEKTENLASLTKKVLDLSVKMLLEVVPLWLNKQIIPKEQDHNQATYCSILTKADGKIDWTNTAEKIYHQIKALNPWPSTYTFLEINKQKKLLKILEIEPNFEINSTEFKSGTLLITDNKLQVISGDNKLITIKKLQLEGKKVMSAEEFSRGYQRYHQSKLK